jgi:hypothetical protein
VLGLSGRDGGSDEELFVSSVEGGVVFEVAAVVARAVILVVIPWFRDQDALSLPAEPPRSHGLGGDTVVMSGLYSIATSEVNERDGELSVWDKTVDK